MRFFVSLLLAAFLSLSAPLALADVQVNVRKDKVHLKDGTVVECIVLMVTSRGVLIVEVDPADPEKQRQRMLPKDAVAKVERGEIDGSVTGFQTDSELANKVILSAGYRTEKKEKEPPPEEQKKTAVAAPAGGPVKPVAAGKTAALPIEPTEKAAVSKMGSEELAKAYVARYPDLKPFASAFLGADKLPSLIDQAQKNDPLLRRQAENALRLLMGLGTGGTGPKRPGGPRPVKPRPPVKEAPAKDAAK